MTRGDLQAVTRKKLAQLARRHRISGWHSMRKDQLVDALVHVVRRSNPPRRFPSADKTRCRLKPARRCDRRGPIRDQLIVEEVDDRWLRARWVLSERILERARVALGSEWHLAVPVLRVYDLTDRNDTGREREFVKDEEIRQAIDDWYVPIERSAQSCRVELGYRTPSGSFFVLARSAKVRTPQFGGLRESIPTEGLGTNGKGRRNGSRRPTSTAARFVTDGDPDFEIGAEVVLYGQAPPQAALTLLGQPVQQHIDGTFAVRMSLEDGRQVIPAVCVSPNGSIQRTIVVAIERNTKRLDPMRLDDPT